MQGPISGTTRLVPRLPVFWFLSAQVKSVSSSTHSESTLTTEWPLLPCLFHRLGMLYWSKNSVLAERIQHRKRKSFNNLPTHYSKEASSSDLGSGSMHFHHAVTPPCHSLMVLQQYSSKSNVTVDWFCLEKISCFSTRLISCNQNYIATSGYL